ncbi:MAG: response regulator [Ardenticatenaceae bacterium]|nr:response regulator [Anaerolineales bacterium]MCB8921353.1 response regulator [Ardenticatenaceae bacterium]MCB9004023.1 response regulator [Ardenticatenaceae bacterium]
MSTAAQSSIPDKAHLLVVDDEPEIAESLADFLVKKEGYRISLASNGLQAIEFLRSTLGTKTEIDLVLLDMRMPGMSGLEVLSWIRNHPELQYTRVVLLTAAATSQDKVEALSTGADDYITKPYYPQELLARVKTILRTQQLEKQLQEQRQQLAALNEVAQSVSATLETREVLETAVTGVDTILDVDAAAIFMVKSGHLYCEQCRSIQHDLELAKMPVIPVGQGIIGTAFTEQAVLYCNEVGRDGRYHPHFDTLPSNNVQNIVAAPLIIRGHAVGVLTAYNKSNAPFTPFDVDLFSSLARAIAEAIENSWLFTHVRQRQQQILESRNTLQALIDGIPHPIYTVNQEWKIVSINKSKADEFPATAEELTGQVCYHAFFQRETPCDHCAAAKTLLQKEVQRWSVKGIGEDHLLREWEVNAYPIPSTQPNAARAVILWQNRSEERRMENTLLQAGKLAAIGQLAAGVAHEINNPLTAINANAQMLKMFIPPEDENYESVDLISQAGERATKVVRGLLDFARQEQYAFESADVNVSIRQALDLVRYQLGTANISIIQNMEENLPEVVASWDHMKSVWLNLLVNARDAVEAVPENRCIEIITRRDMDDNHIQILIRDNGKGITAAEAEHIFEPFYTTKDPGKGTGLGLATSHRIIEQHGGDISVASAPHEGTTFLIRLPIQNGQETL